MFFAQTPPEFCPSMLKGFFAVRSAGRFINAGYLFGFGVCSRKSLFPSLLTLAFLCTVLVTTVHLGQFDLSTNN
jgi:hypothetical protein